MKILFVGFYFDSKIQVFPGIGILSNILRKHGHDTLLYPYLFFNELEINSVLSEFGPDLVAISSTEMSVTDVERLAQYVKEKYRIPVILGGAFPILNPDRAKKIKWLDAVCIGDGKQGMIEFVEDNHPATNFFYADNSFGKRGWTENIGYDIDYKIFQNAASIFGYRISKKLDFWTSFTCEFNCSFCCSRMIRRSMGAKGKPKLSPADAIFKLKEQLDQSVYKGVYFRDPLFIGVYDKQWAIEFLTKYKREIGLPFTCNVRADTVDYDILQLLKDSNCAKVKMGVETGDETLRRNVLNKRESNNLFRTVIAKVKELGMNVSLNAMIGIPYETIESANETLRFLDELDPDESFLHIYQPWTGVHISKEMEQYIEYVSSPRFNNYEVIGKERHTEIPMQGLTSKVVTPVLNQPQFTYEQARDFHRMYLERDKHD